MVKSTRIVIQLFDDRLFIFVVNVFSFQIFFYIIRKDNKIENKRQNKTDKNLRSEHQ